MKRSFALSMGIAAIAIGMLSTPIVRADSTTQTNTEVKAGHKHGVKGSKDKRIQMLTTALGLTEDQVGKVKSIYKAQKTKAAVIKSDPVLSPDDKRTRIASLRKDTKQQLDAVLTDDQQQKLRQFQKERRLARKEGKLKISPDEPAADAPAPAAQ